MDDVHTIIHNPIKARKVLLGQRIKITYMKGEPDYTGKEGIIIQVDDECQLHGTWGGLAVNPEIDKFTFIY